ncbi:hypothetical protein BWN14_09070 [Campylobacter coli]|nr:hypothetical protein [Campylobacter coli]EAJ8662371.1 hypothetical protein [Campylobacter coli]EAK0050769.1 hypothetical protein [Campylobacter coli]
MFNNWVGFLITQVYFIVFIEVLWLGVVYDEINIAVNTCKGLVLSKKSVGGKIKFPFGKIKLP